jgi:hypothetical protein
MYDFPASPTNGQQYGAYTYDGEKWKGGLQTQGVANAEQFFDVSGLANLDIAVPSWAKGVQLIGSVFVPNSNAIWARISFDGTTFQTGATDYTMYGPQLHSGTSAYLAWGTGSQAGFSLTQSADFTTQPHQFTSEIVLVRPSTAVNFSMKTVGRAIDAAAAVASRTWMGSGAFNLAASGSNLSIKAMRLYLQNGGNFPAGSWLKARWLGDLNQQPNGVSIVDAPADGGEYVRVNNVWRLKAQTLVLDGLTTIDVVVPPTAKLGRFDMVFFWANAAAANQLGWRGSLDGTNFAAGASDYFYGGMSHYTGSSGYANLVPANSAYAPVTFASDATMWPLRARVLLNLTRPSNTALFTGLVNGGWYHSPATNLYTDMQFASGIQNLTGLRLQKLRFFNSNIGGLFASPSTISCEWIY